MEQPTSNLTAISLLLAIVVIAALVALIFALLAVTSTRRPRAGSRRAQTGTREGAPATRALPRAVAITKRQAVWAISAVGLFALAGTYASTSTSEYCTSTCHAMTPYADTWKQSSHADTACRSCHESSIVDATSSRVRHAAAQMISPDNANLTTFVPAARCITCHPEAGGLESIEARGIRVVHGHFIDDGADCARCHLRVGHDASPGVRAGTMSECLKCHDGTRAPSACATCHIDDVGFTAVEDRSFGRVRLPQPVCGGCHQETTCDACHGLRMPHPENYADPRLHAAAGAFDGRENLCYRCHTPRDCGECHGVLTLEGGGHTPNWKQGHKQRSFAEGNGYCLACHETPDFCSVCHKR